MVYESFDYSIGEDLILKECHMLKNTQVVLPSGNINIDHLNYDQRISLFQTLFRNDFFKEKSVLVSDLIYWFPECRQQIIPNNVVVAKSSIKYNLEFILAEIMEGNFCLSHFHD